VSAGARDGTLGARSTGPPADPEEAIVSILPTGGLVVVPDRSRIDLTARPALAGVRLAVDLVTGALHGHASTAAAVATGPGGVELGWLVLRLRAIAVPDGPGGPAVPDWLAGGEPAEVRAALIAVEPEGGGRFEIRTRFTVAGRSIPLSGIGRCTAGPPGGERDGDEGTMEASGLTLVDPRALGFGLSPLITHTVNARWRIVLAPTPGPSGRLSGEAGPSGRSSGEAGRVRP
jgi:hypothetical protein